ncbi:hypothetical protein C1645_776368 [Glomus cerebriforme]|uniref:MARVEL domain-containing protein n=1 Tax=Glomus cerebriforme TaxID=658196 RepID=A0A397SY58_9GLOM|nr:hypothetical protein C1645_776368 [Glomus cerebriforme]
MAPRVTNCCVCIPLSNGVVIITLLWLAYGLYVTIVSGLNISSTAVGTANLANMILYLFISIGATFGLYVLSFARTYKLLRIYSKIAYFILAVDIVSNLATVIIFIMSREAIIDLCTAASMDFFSYYSNAEIISECTSKYNSALAGVIALAVISNILSVYFAIVISSYVQRKKEKEDAAAVTANSANVANTVNVPTIVTAGVPIRDATGYVTAVAVAVDQNPYGQAKEVDQHPFGQTKEDMP